MLSMLMTTEYAPAEERRELQHSVILRQHLHLTDGNGVEFRQSLRLRDSFVDEHCIQIT